MEGRDRERRSGGRKIMGVGTGKIETDEWKRRREREEKELIGRMREGKNDFKEK